MASPVPSPASSSGATDQAATSQKQANNSSGEKTEPADGNVQDPAMEEQIAQLTAGTGALSTQEASTENSALSVPKNYLEKELSLEILFLIFDNLGDLESITALSMSCKRLQEAFLNRQEAIQSILLLHQGQGFIGCADAIVAVKMPTMDALAVRDVNNVIKAMQFFWGRPRDFWNSDPYDSDIDSPHMAIIEGMRASQGLPPTPKSTISQDFQQLQWRAIRYISGPIPTLLPDTDTDTNTITAANSSAQDVDDTATSLAIRARGIDPIASTLTCSQARELADLGLCVQKLSVAYIRSCPWPDETNMLRVQNSLWALESFCRLFGGRSWWQRWAQSLHMERIEKVFQGGRFMNQRGDDIMDVHMFLSLAVEAKWKQVMEHQETCRCPHADDDDDSEMVCNKCCLQGADGAIAMGLPVICRLLETDDVEELRDCFVWSDGLPVRHPYFLLHFFTLRGWVHEMRQMMATADA
ncbi:hypothetical protein VM1G_04858 [Cytospora mali]|uniref:Uncharacterized protein n=1 Tax=Cytospora mali TaxID=578113 RepID=A0A194VZN6_CYTMA|nr:hypothetical protein VM1G_04858 [Valsa mali]